MSKISGLKKPYVHRWAIGRPILPVIATQSIAALSLDAMELIGMVRSGLAARVVYEHDSEAGWIELYRNPGRFSDDVNSHAIPMADGSMVANIHEAINQRQPYAQAEAMVKIDEIPPEMQSQAKELLDQFFQGLYEENCQSSLVHIKERSEPSHLAAGASYGELEMLVLA